MYKAIVSGPSVTQWGGDQPQSKLEPGSWILNPLAWPADNATRFTTTILLE